MNGNAHDTLNTWAAPPPPTILKQANEICEWVEREVCAAINCVDYSIGVSIFGSVRNETHTKFSSDIDLAVVPRRCRCDNISCEIVRGDDASVLVCDLLRFRKLLFDRFQKLPSCVSTRWQEHSIRIRIKTTNFPVDVVVLVPKRWLKGCCPRCGAPCYEDGYEVRSTERGPYTYATWPDRHHNALNEYDQKSKGRYKSVVRAVKGICHTMKKHRRYKPLAENMCGVLIENLFALVPAWRYCGDGSCYWKDLTCTTTHLRSMLTQTGATSFDDLSGQRKIFEPGQKWCQHEALNFITFLNQEAQNQRISALSTPGIT